MIFVMDFLASHELLQTSLFKGVAEEKVAAGMGGFMGTLHAKTHCTKTATTKVTSLSKAYENSTLRGIQLEYVFSKCFREDERASHLRSDSVFMAEVEALKALYRGENKNNLALCHGDLHAGSVMVTTEDVKVIDPEFAVYGPPGLDVGSLMSTYVMAYCFQSSVNKSSHKGLLSAIEAVWSSYSKALKAGGIGDDVIELIGQDAVGFAGCEVARTALGLAFERSLKIEDPKKKDEAERDALALGVACILNRKQGLSALTAELTKFGVNESSQRLQPRKNMEDYYTV